MKNKYIFIAVFLFWNALFSQSQLGDYISGFSGTTENLATNLATSADGLTVAIGASNLGPGFGRSDAQGGVFVMRFNPNPCVNDWDMLGDPIFLEGAPDCTGIVGGSNICRIGDRGLDISADGTIVAIGAAASTAIRVYEFNGTDWVQKGNSIPISSFTQREGVTLSDDGLTVAVASVSSVQSTVKMYEFSSGIWTQKGNSIVLPGDINPSIAIDFNSDGTIIAVGNPRANPISYNRYGQVQVYQYDGISTWNQLGGNIQSGTSFFELGKIVALSNDGLTLVASTTRLASSVLNSGVMVYQYSSGAWTQRGAPIYGTFGNGSVADVGISGNGSRVIVGFADEVYNNEGFVRVYDFIGGAWSQINVPDITDNRVELTGYTVAINDDGNLFSMGHPILNNTSLPPEFQTGIVKTYCFDCSSFPTVPTPGSDGNGFFCNDDTSALNLHDIITGETFGGTWTRIGGTGGTFDAAAGTFIPAGASFSNTFQYTVSGLPASCSTSNAYVFVYESANAGADIVTSVCNNSTAIINLQHLLSPGAIINGFWTRLSGTGGTFNAAARTFIPTGATTSTFQYTALDNSPGAICGGNDTSILTINIDGPANAGTDGAITVCDNSAAAINLVDLIVGEGTGGVWTRLSGTGGTFDAGAGTFIPTGATSSTFQYIINNACGNDSSIATVTTLNCMPTTIDFDGVDDYISETAFLGGNAGVSQMSWVRLNPSHSGGAIMGQDNFRLWIESDGRISGSVTTTTNSYVISSTATLTNDIWAHVACIYNGSDFKLYLNGEEVASVAAIGNLTAASGTYEIGRDATASNNYIYAFIDDSRVYNVALTEQQLREQIYQEIQINGGAIEGLSIAKPIAGLSATALQLYYKMDPINLGKVIDQSSYNRDGTLYNITTVQEQNAPMPYVANASGAWTTIGTWEHGNHWDITTLPNRNWAIVQISNNAVVTTVDTHTHLGLIVDSGAELEMNNDQGLFNTSYLELDGVLDLNGESQLVQTTTSDLAVSSAGRLERDQQGRGDIFSYNNWSAPVSTISTVANNLGYSPNTVMMDGTNPSSPQPITYVTGFDGAPTTPITISNYWFWIFENQPDDYSNWVQSFETGSLKAGQGYTMKGPGTGTTMNTQNYVFSGKPNNGSIDHTIDPNNLSLLGNPYPSALDADQFIIDNSSVIEEDGNVIGAPIVYGAIYRWDHFETNASHNLDAYEGGYATYNLTGATVAIPDPGVSSNGTGTKLPTRYIPVGQAFFVQGGAGGTINFNNNQRAFVTESSGGSIFMFDGNTTEDDTPPTQVSEPNPEIDRIYFRFTTPEGPQRQLLLGVKQGVTLGLDYGYDARLLENNPTDASWAIDNLPYVIQAIGSIEEDLALPLHIHSDTGGDVSLAIEELQGIDEDIEIYLLDKNLNSYQDLRVTTANFKLTAGEHLDRYFIVFKNVESEEDPIIDDTTTDDLVIYHNNGALIIENPALFDADNIRVYNTLGQVVFKELKNYDQVTQISLPMTLSSGAYFVKLNYNKKEQITRKIVMNK